MLEGTEAAEARATALLRALQRSRLKCRGGNTCRRFIIVLMLVPLLGSFCLEAWHGVACRGMLGWRRVVCMTWFA